MRSRALEEWRREVRKSRRCARAAHRGGVVHFARLETPPVRFPARRVGRGGEPVAAVLLRSLFLALVLLGCVAWLASLLGR